MNKVENLYTVNYTSIITLNTCWCIFSMRYKIIKMMTSAKKQASTISDSYSDLQHCCRVLTCGHNRIYWTVSIVCCSSQHTVYKTRTANSPFRDILRQSVVMLMHKIQDKKKSLFTASSTYSFLHYLLKYASVSAWTTIHNLLSSASLCLQSAIIIPGSQKRC